MITTNIPWLPSTLENEMVKLELLETNDFDRLFAVASDPLIWEQHPTRDRYKREVFQVYFDSGIASKAAFLVFDKATNKLIGCTRFYNYNPDDSSIAIGWTFLAREYWGGKYNSAMKKLLLNEAFKYLNKVYLHIGPTNIRSQTATMKIGAKKVREVLQEEHGVKPGHYEYVINKEDYSN